MQRITGHEYPISKIFSEEFEFSIPSYQRPYAWTTEEAGELIDDLLSFKADQGLDGVDPYFLGSIVLIKADGRPDAEVIDGQQRLTTLTILLAVLAEHCTGERRNALAKYINEPGDLAEDRDPKPRLTLRERDSQFFRKHIQTMGGVAALDTVNAAEITDPQRNMLNNARHFVERITGMDEQAAFDFARFIVQRCFLVAVSTPSMHSAYRIFSVMNDRGLDLLTCDILKSHIIGSIPEPQRDEYTERWEEVEELLGREAFNELFTHIRMIYVRAKAKRSVLDEFRESVLTKEKDGRNLIERVIEPFAEAYATLLNANYKSESGAEIVNALVRWLRRLDNFDWIPPALLFMSTNPNDTAALSKFFVELERLAASMFIRRVPINKRIERYAKVLGAIESGKVLSADSALMITEEECGETRACLAGDLYHAHAAVRSYVLLRLDNWLSDGAAVYDYQVLTVEHVLPQTVAPGSKWAAVWTAADQETWVHKLGNLVLLTRKKNAQAQNYDFEDKKSRYFSGRGGVSSFTLTSQVLSEHEWTPAVVRRRHDRLLKRLVDGWRLSIVRGSS